MNKFIFLFLFLWAPLVFSQALDSRVVSFHEKLVCYRSAKGIQCFGALPFEEPPQWSRNKQFLDKISDVVFFGPSFFLRSDGLFYFKKHEDVLGTALWIPYYLISQGIVDVKFSIGTSSTDGTICLKNTQGQYTCLLIQDGQFKEQILETEPETLDLRIVGKKIFYHTLSSARVYDGRVLVFDVNDVNSIRLSSEHIIYQNRRTLFKYSVKSLTSESARIDFIGSAQPLFAIPILLHEEAPTVFFIFKDRYELWGSTESNEAVKKDGFKGSVLGRKTAVKGYRHNTLIERNTLQDFKLAHVNYVSAGGDLHDVLQVFFSNGRNLVSFQVRPFSSYKDRLFDKSINDYVYSSKSFSRVEDQNWKLDISSLIKDADLNSATPSFALDNIVDYLYSFDAVFMKTLLGQDGTKKSAVSQGLMSQLAQLFAKNLNYPVIRQAASKWQSKEVKLDKSSFEINRALAQAFTISITSARTLMAADDVARLTSLINELASYQIEGSEYKNVMSLKILLEQSRDVLSNYLLHPYLAARVPVQMKIIDLLSEGLTAR